MPLTPCLFLPGNAEEVGNYYVDVFPDAAWTDELRVPGPDGSDQFITGTLIINGSPLQVLNGADGATQTFNPAFSLVALCQHQAEVDHLWDRFLADGGKEIGPAWIADKFGFYWQIVPEGLPLLLQDPDPVRAEKAMNAMNSMHKIDLAAISAAVDAKE